QLDRALRGDAEVPTSEGDVTGRLHFQGCGAGTQHRSALGDDDLDRQLGRTARVVDLDQGRTLRGAQYQRATSADRSSETATFERRGPARNQTFSRSCDHDELS